MKKILFLVNGLGLGNATRCHAIMERLLEFSVSIDIMTSGNGFWYFQNNNSVGNVSELSSLQYGAKNGKISILKTLLPACQIINTLLENSRSITRYLHSNQPDVIVTDSFYNFRTFRKSIPIISINNSDIIVQLYKSIRNKPREIRAQFNFIEKSDYIFHKHIPSISISPSLDETLPTYSNHFKRVGPIIRENYVQPHKAKKEKVVRIVVMLSGSSFGAEIKSLNLPNNMLIDVIGRCLPEGQIKSDKVTYHGKIINIKEILQKADIVVVNGGFSAVSEMLCMGKPMIVIPIPNHAEQWINAYTIEKLGVGVNLAEGNDLSTAINHMLLNLDVYKESYKKINCSDGAAQAADIIMGFEKF